MRWETLNLIKCESPISGTWEVWGLEGRLWAGGQGSEVLTGVVGCPASAGGRSKSRAAWAPEVWESQGRTWASEPRECKETSCFGHEHSVLSAGPHLTKIRFLSADSYEVHKGATRFIQEVRK